jgi:hypothetical protein
MKAYSGNGTKIIRILNLGAVGDGRSTSRSSEEPPFFKRLVMGGARVCLNVTTKTGILPVPNIEPWSSSSQLVTLLTLPPAHNFYVINMPGQYTSAAIHYLLVIPNGIQWLLLGSHVPYTCFARAGWTYTSINRRASGPS